MMLATMSNPQKPVANGINAMPIAMMAKQGTEAVLRPNRSIRNPAGTNMITSISDEVDMIKPIRADPRSSAFAA